LIWSNIAVYVLSYLYIYDSDINVNAIFYVDLAAVILASVGQFLGAYLINDRKWNPKAVALLGGCIYLGGTLTSAYMTNFWLFLFFYAAVSTLGLGISYLIPMISCWDYFPERKGLITGIMVSSYGLSSFVNNALSTLTVNPNNEKTYHVGPNDISFFHEDVAMRVPYMLKVLIILWTSELIIAIVFLSRPKKDNGLNMSINQMEKIPDSSIPVPNIDPQSKQIYKDYNVKTIRSVFHSKRFWQYALMMFLSQIYTTFFMY